ncbi:MAG: RIP metalloprotease RseP [Herbinix sp.]|nr:RIP metalloprotease RseP [Herbinix sp.]
MNVIVAILILGLIVIVHELGHFLLAKKNGITVTEFSVGMGPRLASFVRNGTRYSLKLFPIGGSCMMLGEDETVDDEGAFHKKGVWARFSVIFAGAFFNFILAFVLSLILLGNVGVDKPYVTDVKAGSPADGKLVEDDLITKINGSPIHFGREIGYYYYFNSLSEEPIKITYLRDGKMNTTLITPVWKDTYLLGIDNYTVDGVSAKITILEEGYPLAEAGFAVGDVIVKINGTEIVKGQDLKTYLKNNPLTGDAVNISYLKGGTGDPIMISVIPKLVNSGYNMGWSSNLSYQKVSALQVVKYSFFELKSNIVNTIKSVFYLVTGRVSAKEISGPVGIVNVVGNIVTNSKDYGIRVMLLELINFSILISANLGVMNLLPLPALDGGRLVFLLIEAIRRKPVPKEKEAVVHMIGMALLMLLMVFVLFNDIRNIMG